jgi:branched-chain amino acid transport system substrate-binding protein
MPKGVMRNLRLILAFVTAAATLTVSEISAHGEARKSIRIGYAISMTGANQTGANITVIPNYRMWVREVNEAGGIWLHRIGKRLPIEVIEYDDQSNAEGAVRGVDRLVNEDKVDFILSPWGTGLNLAVAPLLSAAGYPDIVSTALVERAPELVKQWPNSFWLLGTAAESVQALIQILGELRAEGKISNRVAMMNVADQFGIDLSKVARIGLRRAKFELAYDRPYPVGTPDMRPALTDVMRVDADAFIAFSYPPDTMLLAEQSMALNFNPKVLFTAVGAAYPLFRDKFGASAEGILGMGGWHGDAPESQRYLRRHIALTGQEPDRWASPVTYAGLQMLQQAIERVGEIDRAAVIKELQTGTFETVVGSVKLENNFRKGVYGVGQWQGGEFYGVAPTTLAGARQIEFPKPVWSGK